MAHTRRARAGVPRRSARRKTERRFSEENAELLAFRRSLEGPDAPELAPWDVAYYAEKQRAALYDFDEEALRPYFPLERVVAGTVRPRQPAVRHSRRRGAGRAGVGSGRCSYYDMRDEDGDVPRRLLRRLVSAREQARRRLDGLR